MDVGENVVYHFQHFFPWPLWEESNRNYDLLPQAEYVAALSNFFFFFFFPLPIARGKGFVVSLRNKELREVGRHDFELGSDPVFPAEREEMVLGRMVYNV